MNIKTRCLVVWLLIFVLLIPFSVSANRGMIVVGPKVDLEESGQNAIVAWNGKEEVIILSTDVKSSESSLVLEVLPLPSNPAKIEQGSFDSFTKLVEIVNKKVMAVRKQKIYGTLGAEGVPAVEITFHKKIGAHDVTVVKVNELDYFINWIKNFTASKGFEYTEISPEFKNTVANYLNRDIKFFVFDVIETDEARQTIKPLVYRFKTDFLYYPLEITATSDAGWSRSKVNIFLIAKGMINETTVRNVNLWPRAGFDYIIELNENELKEISPEIADLFSSAYVMNVHYYGSLSRLDKDLVVYQHDVYVPTFFDKFSQVLSTFLVFRHVSELGRMLLSWPAPTLVNVLLAVHLFSFILGIPSTVFVIAKLIKKMLKKYKLKSFGYSLFAYAASTIVVVSLLLSNVLLLAIFVLVVFTIIGFSMIIFLTIKFLKKYVF